MVTIKNPTLREPGLAIAVLRTEVNHTSSNLAGKSNLEEINDLRADRCRTGSYHKDLTAKDCLYLDT